MIVPLVQPMNQASRKSWVVPVLPATVRPAIAAARPVPRDTTAAIMRAIMPARSGSTTCGGGLGGGDRDIARPCGLHRGDAGWGDREAAVEEAGIGGGHFQQADLAGAEGERGVVRQDVGDAEAVGDGGDEARAAGLQQQPNRGGVERVWASASSSETSPR